MHVQCLHLAPSALNPGRHSHRPRIVHRTSFLVYPSAAHTTSYTAYLSLSKAFIDIKLRPSVEIRHTAILKNKKPSCR